jgi:hypothetical protein
VARWEILAGRDPGSLEQVATVPWNGLDTRARVPESARWVAAAAENAAGDIVATSVPVRVAG